MLNDEPLSEQNRDHPLHGDYEGYRECHITPDWLLIYVKDTEIKIFLVLLLLNFFDCKSTQKTAICCFTNRR